MKTFQKWVARGIVGIAGVISLIIGIGAPVSMIMEGSQVSFVQALTMYIEGAVGLVGLIALLTWAGEKSDWL